MYVPYINTELYCIILFNSIDIMLSFCDIFNINSSYCFPSSAISNIFLDLYKSDMIILSFIVKDIILLSTYAIV